MLLVRATRLTPNIEAFGRELAAEAGLDVAFLIDGRFPPDADSQVQCILVTSAACRDLGLHTPPDFAWRCGDYGLYLARRLFPQVTHFWLVEYDIRLAGAHSKDFFSEFERRPEYDFLACCFRPADLAWWWRPAARGLGVRPHRCLFGIVRLSAPGLDHLLKKRRQQSRNPIRHKLWPNDEGFVATTLACGGFRCADFNDFGGCYYDDDTLSLLKPIRGETFKPWRDGVMIYHPVLFGGDFVRGNQTALAAASGAAATQPRSKYKVYSGRLLRGVIALQPW